MTPAPETVASSALAAAHPAFEAGCRADPPWIRAVRASGLSRFRALGLPGRRDESWKYTSLRALGELAFAPRSAPGELTAAALAPLVDASDVTLVFVDGVLSPVHSQALTGNLPAGLTLTPLATAFARREATVRRLLGGLGTAALPPFAELSHAYLQSGLLVEVAPGAVLGRRLHLIHATTGSRIDGAPAALFPRHLMLLGANSAADVVETFIGTVPDPYLVVAGTDIELEAGARLRHARVQLEGAGGFHIGRLRCALARDASLATLSLAAGARLARLDLDVALTGPGAHAQLDGLYLVKGEQHVDHHTLVDHMVPDATSTQLYKGILGGQSRAVFNGKVTVRRDAQRTSAHQLNRNLLLNPGCEVDTKPELAIDADDVKCAHGAAVGPLRQDLLFYLASRGIARAEGIRMLSAAFADEVLMKDTVPGLAARLRPLTMEFFR